MAKKPKKAQGQISHAEVEVPELEVDSKFQISYVFFLVPTIPTDGLVSWAEMEVPD